MEAVHLGDKAFESQFPDYKRWLSFKRNEIGGLVPWRRNTFVNRAAQETSPERTHSDAQAVLDSSDAGSLSQRIVLEPMPYYYGRKIILNRPRRIIPLV